MDVDAEIVAALGITDVVRLPVLQDHAPAAAGLYEIGRDLFQKVVFPDHERAVRFQPEKVVVQRARPRGEHFAVADEDALGRVVRRHPEISAVAGEQHVLPRFLICHRRIQHGGNDGAALLIIGMRAHAQLPVSAGLGFQHENALRRAVRVRHREIAPRNALGDLLRRDDDLVRLVIGIEIFPDHKAERPFPGENDVRFLRTEEMRDETLYGVFGFARGVFDHAAARAEREGACFRVLPVFLRRQTEIQEVFPLTFAANGHNVPDVFGDPRRKLPRGAFRGGIPRGIRDIVTAQRQPAEFRPADTVSARRRNARVFQKFRTDKGLRKGGNRAAVIARIRRDIDAPVQHAHVPAARLVQA